MKKIYMMAMGLLMSTTIWAQNKVNVVIFSEDGDPFFVFINGVRQNTNPETNVRVTDLNMESFSFKVVFANSKLEPLSKNQYLPFGNEYTFRIKKDKKGNLKLAPFGQVELAQAPASNNSIAYHSTELPATTTGTSTTGTTGTATTVTTGTTTTGTTVNETGNGNVNMNVGVTGTGTTTESTTVTTTTTGTTTNAGTGTENVNISMGVNGTGISMNVNVTDPNMQGGTGNVSTNVGVNGTTTTSSSTTVTTTTTTSGYSTGTTTTSAGTTGTSVGTANTSTNVSNNNGACYSPVSDSDFKSIKSSISSKSFADAKLTVAKQAIEANCMTSGQIKEVMGLFDFEDNKLDFAKHAYSYVYDRNNYYKVNDAFDFETSVDELNDYIKTKK